MEVPDGLVALQYFEGKPGVWRDCVVVEIQVDWPEVLLAHLLGRATWGRLSMGEKVEKHPEHSKLYFCAPHQSTSEGAQLDFYFDLIFASKKDRTVNNKVA